VTGIMVNNEQLVLAGATHAFTRTLPDMFTTWTVVVA